MTLRRRSVFAIAVASVFIVAGCGTEGDSTPARDGSASAEAFEQSDAPEATEVEADIPAETAEPAPMRASAIDGAGDPVDGNGKKYPGRHDLDIRRVGLAETASGVRMVVTLAGPPTADNIYVLLACDATGNGCSVIETRRDVDGKLDTSWYDMDDSKVRPLNGAASFNNKLLTVDIPADAFVTAPPFEWRVTVATRSAVPEINDHLPNESADIGEVPMAKFG